MQYFVSTSKNPRWMPCHVVFQKVVIIPLKCTCVPKKHLQWYSKGNMDHFCIGYYHSWPLIHLKIEELGSQITATKHPMGKSVTETYDGGVVQSHLLGLSYSW